MYNGTYAPWEHYPKNLRHYEIENPMSVVEDFFSCDTVKGHSKRLKEWRHYVVNDEHYDEKRHGPGTLLFVYDMNLRFLEGLYLMLYQYNENSYMWKEIEEEQLADEKEQWKYYPNNLSLKEQLNPYKVIKKAFKKTKPQAYRDYLHEWVHSALYIRADTEGLYAGEVILVYESLLKLYSAAWLIYKRKSNKSIIKPAAVSIKPFIPTIQAPIKEINPELSRADELGLEEIKKLLLERITCIQMIICIGKHSEPLNYYLVVLIDNKEKAPEHEIANKIEDNCKLLASVFAIVHKVNSAVESIPKGKRFWNTALFRGIVIHQSANLTLPEPTEILDTDWQTRAAENWQRWGVQGKEFFKGSERYIEEGNFDLATFLLHQAAESSLIAIVRVVLGYRLSAHNLSKMLKLTLLFTDAIYNTFDLNNNDDAQLFSLLQSSYSETRYKSNYKADEEKVRSLIVKVEILLAVIEQVYQRFIEAKKIM